MLLFSGLSWSRNNGPAYVTQITGYGSTIREYFCVPCQGSKFLKYHDYILLYPPSWLSVKIVLFMRYTSPNTSPASVVDAQARSKLLSDNGSTVEISNLFHTKAVNFCSMVL